MPGRARRWHRDGRGRGRTASDGHVLLALTLLVLGLTWVAACDSAERPRALPLAANRLYSGAPPTIPHQVADRNRQECLSCHLYGDATADDGHTLAKATPHPELENCPACHVPSRGRGQFRPSRFVGKTYAIGIRAQPAGPWAIPHPLTMRENCLGCHDTRRTHPVLRVTHPERQRCVQCHLPAYGGFPGPRPDVPRVPGVPGLLAARSR